MKIEGLTEFQRDLLETSEQLPRHLPKIMRKVGSKARAQVVKKSRTLVKKQTGNYHKSWKRGKVFKNGEGEWVVRVINSSPHAHLIEDGHKQVTKDGKTVGFVRGKGVLRKSMQEFESGGTADDMFSDFIDDLLEQNKL